MAIIEEQSRYETLRSDIQAVTFSYLGASYEERGGVFDEAEQTLLCFKNEEGFYTNLGLLFSDQCTQFTHIAVFQGTNMAIFRDRREFTGSLLEQMDRSMDYIQQYNRIRSEFAGLVRSDQYDYPPLALREMLLNAYAHRQYSVSAPTLIRLFDDRIECITVGGLAPSLTMEDIMLGISVSRNEYVTRVFHHVGIAEAYGTGIPRIFEQYDSYACKPEIETSANAFKLTLPNRNYVTEHVGEMEGAYEAYQFIKRNPMCGRLDLQQFLGSSQTHAGVILSRLVEKGVLITHGKRKNTKYSVK